MSLDETGFENEAFIREENPTVVSESPQNENKKSLEVNGVTWHYLEHGNPNGINVLNLHGWLGSSAKGNARLAETLSGEIQNSPGLQALAQNNPDSARNFEEGVKSLKDKYHVITPELPGFGTTAPIDNVSLDKLADSIFDFQIKLGTEKSIVFGSSMGGILAAKLATRHPENAKMIVLQGTMTRPEDMDKITYLAMQTATSKPISFLLDKLNLSEKLFASIIKGSKDFKLADKATQDEILTATFRADRPTVVNTLKEIGQDIGKDIEKIQCPVVILDGANGELVPIIGSHEATKRFHPNLSLDEKFPEKVVFLPIGGKSGEQGHNIINTFPEGVALWINAMANYYSKNETKEIPQVKPQ